MKVGLEVDIDRRIKEASGMLATARKTENLDKELRRPVRELIRVCDLLVEIVKDQQIEMLRLRRDVETLGESRAMLTGIAEIQEGRIKRLEAQRD